MLAPAKNDSWNIYQAAHLLNRAGFGGTPDEIKALCQMGRPAAIEHLLTVPAKMSAPPEIADQRAALRMMVPGSRDSDETKMKLRELRKQSEIDMRNLRAWWVARMDQPDAAALEKAVLFWHGHFATSIQKVRDVRMMLRQNETLRANAFGNFGTLVKAISRDPAMMVWLDLQRSEMSAPNENFAREVMELFTLGIGHYSEQDIKEAARAFTGHRLNRGEGTYRFATFQHDDSTKTFMGKTGAFGGDEIIDIILAQPACAEFICRKLWTFYGYENAEPELIQSLATVLRKNSYEIRPLLTTIFGSEEFNSARAVRSQIKSPTQLIVQTWRTLECDPAGTAITQQQMIAGLGQNLFAPPSVKGWDGNRNWINTSTLNAREQFADTLLGRRKVPAKLLEAGRAIPRVNIDQIVPDKVQKNPDSLVEYLAFRLFQTPLTPADKTKYLTFLQEPASNGEKRTTRDLIGNMMKTVEFQLV